MSDLQRLLGYSEPIINASMAGVAGGELAAAVSSAGGVGMIGCPTTPTSEWIAQQGTYVQELETPWGVGFIGWAIEEDLAPLEVFLELEPSMVTISFGDPTRAAALAHEAGVLTAMQVGNAAELDRAMHDDIDIIIARGSEGGGHGRNEVGTLPLLQLACAQRHKPVIAAGGIGTAHGVAAVLAGGAEAAWVGTRFLAATEASGHEHLKLAAVHAGLDDTVYTRAFDIAQQLPWAPEFGGRAIRNQFSDEYAEHLARLTQSEQLRERMQHARATADTAMAPVYAGQAVQFVDREESAAQIMAELAGFRQVLAAVANRFA